MSRKNKKGANVFPMSGQKHTAVPMIDELFNDMDMGDMPPMDFLDNVMGDMARAMLGSAQYLTTSIIDNRVRNSEKMSDEDIYEIYEKSFNVAMKTIELKS